MKILTIASQKGGVGKTTLSINVAAALALMQSYEQPGSPGRVLLVDMDPQSHASKTLAGGVFGVDEDESESDKQTLGDLLLGESTLPATAIIETSHLPKNSDNNLDYFPTQKASLNVATRTLTGEPDGQYRLMDLLHPLKALYEYIIIDTPPNLGVMTINSLLAGTHVVIPIDLQAFALDSLVETLDTVERIQNHPRLNPDLKVIGISPVKCHLQRHEQVDWLETLTDRYGDLILPTIGDRGDVHSAQTQGLDIFSYKPSRDSTDLASSNLAAQEYAKISETIRNRMNG